MRYFIINLFCGESLIKYAKHVQTHMYIKKYSKTVFSMLADGHFDDWFDLGCVYYCFLILYIKLEFHSQLELETMNFSVFYIYVHIHVHSVSAFK